MEKRVVFDFEVLFTNGGSLKGEDFRLDIFGDDIADDDLIDYIVKDLRLLMVGKVSILNKKVIAEAHKRGHVGHYLEEGTYIDLSHNITNGLITYKGLPAPIICDFLSREDSRKFYEDGTEFQIGKIEMVSNTGTYIDVPFHRFEDGRDLSDIELRCFADLDAVVIRVSYEDRIEITRKQLEDYDIRGKAVLINTGWDRFWNTDNYYENHPFLTAGAAQYLRDCAVKLVGIDSHNIDSAENRSRPVHTILLGAEILIVEHLCNLGLLPDEGFKFSAVPPKFVGVGTFPVRAFARIVQG